MNKIHYFKSNWIDHKLINLVLHLCPILKLSTCGNLLRKIWAKQTLSFFTTYNYCLDWTIIKWFSSTPGFCGVHLAKGLTEGLGPPSFHKAETCFCFIDWLILLLIKGELPLKKKMLEMTVLSNKEKNNIKRVKLLRKLYIESFSQDIKITLQWETVHTSEMLFEGQIILSEI